MTVADTRLLNQWVASYVTDYLSTSLFSKTGTRLNSAAWNFLRLSGLDYLSSYNVQRAEAIAIAEMQRHMVLENIKTGRLASNDRSLRINGGPQAWLIYTYMSALEKIYELDKGAITYGINGGVYRFIPENVISARMMFEAASLRLAKAMVEIYGEIGNHLVLLEGGAGNGAATWTTLDAFHKKGLSPQFCLTDIDPKTMPVAEEYFRQNGFNSRHFPWSQLDIGDPNAVNSLLNSFPGFKTVMNINFIVHEWEPIAEKLFATMSRCPDTDLVISEFFLPPGYPNCEPDPDFPWWFVFLHELSGQYLRTEEDFMKIIHKYGYEVFRRIDHQKHNGHAVTATLFLRKK